MGLSLYCKLVGGTDKGGEDVELYAGLELPETGDPCCDPMLDLFLTRLDTEVDSELDRLAAETAFDYAGQPTDVEEGETFEDYPDPGDDVDTPDRGTVYVTPDQVFTGQSEYEFQIVLTRDEFKAKLREQVLDRSRWTFARKYGERAFKWYCKALLVTEGNAD